LFLAPTSAFFFSPLLPLAFARNAQINNNNDDDHHHHNNNNNNNNNKDNNKNNNNHNNNRFPVAQVRTKNYFKLCCMEEDLDRSRCVKCSNNRIARVFYFYYTRSECGLAGSLGSTPSMTMSPHDP
jgi:hypothetical protein